MVIGPSGQWLHQWVNPFTDWLITEWTISRGSRSLGVCLWLIHLISSLFLLVLFFDCRELSNFLSLGPLTMMLLPWSQLNHSLIPLKPWAEINTSCLKSCISSSLSQSENLTNRTWRVSFTRKVGLLGHNRLKTFRWYWVKVTFVDHYHFISSDNQLKLLWHIFIFTCHTRWKCTYMHANK